MTNKNEGVFNSNLCAICKYSITDPVCPSCYSKQTLILLKDLKIDSMIRQFIKNKLKHAEHLDTLNDTECILCKQGTVTLCGYCFSIRLIKILRDLNFPEELIENFKYNARYENNQLEEENMFEEKEEIKESNYFISS